MSDLPQLSVAFVLYPGFEILDTCGPYEMFGNLAGVVTSFTVAEAPGVVTSAQHCRMVADYGFADCPAADMLLMPGGIGTREEVENKAMLDWVRERTPAAEYVTAVCTGSAILAKAGVLDGKRATSNKMALSWVMEQGPHVEWVKQARWVEDGKFWTSSGVTAGMDMALALIERIYGAEIAKNLGVGTEYERHTDPNWDPFAKIHGWAE